MVASGVVQNFQQLVSANSIFEVPHFQRNYSWEQKQVEELYSDIEKTASGSDTHFMGSLILLNDGQVNGPVQVVDGQQRLTTLFLLIALIRDRAVSLSISEIPGGNFGAPIVVSQVAQSLLSIPGQGSQLRFLPHPLVREIADKHIWVYPSAARPKLPERHFNYTLELRKAYKKLNSLLESSLSDLSDDLAKLKHLNRLLETIQYKLQLLNVTSTQRSESYEIFMTLNSRGLALGPSDLVKSEIFKNLTKSLSNEENNVKSAELTSDWRSIAEYLEGGDIDQFLRHYLVSKYEGSLTSRRIFEKVENLIEGTTEDPRDPRVESEVLLKELMRNAEIYSKLLSGETEDMPDSTLRLQILASITDSYRIFLLPVLDPRIPLATAERQELIRLTEALALRWVITGQNAQKLEDVFQELSLSLRSGAAFQDVVKHISQLFPPDDRVAREFDYEVDSKNLVRAVLYTINRLWDRTQVIPLDASKIHVEHIAPEKATEHWMSTLFPNDSGVDRDAEYSAAVELWGNKTLLDAKINQSVKQGSFIDKARGLTEDDWAGYEHSTLSITTDLSNHLTAWDRNEISMRSKWIAESFLKIWAISPRPDAVERYSSFRRRFLTS